MRPWYSGSLRRKAVVVFVAVMCAALIAGLAAFA
jgi:hypothetical protein